MTLFSNTRRCLFTLLALCILPVAQLAAQETKPTLKPPAADTIPVVKHITPRGAFIRSLIVPGWGQFSVGANTRGAIFVGLQSASWYMLIKTLNKLNTAQDEEAAVSKPVEDSLRAAMAKDTLLARQLANEHVFREKVRAHPDVAPAHSLVTSREQQRQDWITYVLFTTLASGVDAYVAAHLADFPGTISAQPQAGGGAQFRVTMPVGRRRE